MVAAVVAAVALAAPAHAHGDLADDPGFADLVERLSPAVVSIVATRAETAPEDTPDGAPDGTQRYSPREFFEDFFFRRAPRSSPYPRQRPRQGTPSRALGSGFVFDDKEKLIVTADHILGDAGDTNNTLEIAFADGSVAPAMVVGRDSRTDIAILKVDTEKDLTPVPLAKAGTARVGEWVMAMGNPLGVGRSATVGVISAINRDIGQGPYDEFIQTDAAVNRGNSGGPLFNVRGEVVGVITSIYSPTGFFIGLAFAAPASTVAPVLEQLRATGEVERAWIGVRIQGVSPEIARSLALGQPRGALVVEITPDSPALRAGLQRGDLIISFNGHAIIKTRDLSIAASRAKVGATAVLEVVRDGETIDVDVVLGTLDEDRLAQLGSPRAPAPEQANNDYLWQTLGARVAPLDAETRAKLGIDETTAGLTITRLRSGGPFDAVGVSEGEAILAFAGEPVASARDLERLAQRIARRGRDGGLCFVQGPSGGRYVGVLLDSPQE